MRRNRSRSERRRGAPVDRRRARSCRIRCLPYLEDSIGFGGRPPRLLAKRLSTPVPAPAPSAICGAPTTFGGQLWLHRVSGGPDPQPIESAQDQSGAAKAAAPIGTCEPEAKPLRRALGARVSTIS